MIEPGLDLLWHYGVADKGRWKTTPKSTIWLKANELLDKGGKVRFYEGRKFLELDTVLGGRIAGLEAGGSEVVLFACDQPEEEDTYGTVYNYGVRGNILQGALRDTAIDSGVYGSFINKWFRADGEYDARRRASGLHLFDVETERRQPAVIVACGDKVIKALFGSDATYERYSGQITNWRNTEGSCFPVICTVDPIKVADQPELRDELLLGLIRVKRFLNGHRFDAVEDGLERFVCRSREDLEGVLRQIRDAFYRNGRRWLAIDAEWHGAHPCNQGGYVRCFQVSWAGKCAALVELNAEGGRANPESSALIQAFNDFLRETEPTIIGHFLVADMEWLVPLGLTEIKRLWFSGRGFDTGLAAHALWEDSRLKLEYLLERHLGIPRYDYALYDWKKQQKEKQKESRGGDDGYGNVPKDILYPYAMYDADGTFRLAEYLEPLLAKDQFGLDCRNAFRRRMRATQGIYEINTTGMLVDKQRLIQFIHLYQDKQKELLYRIREKCGWEEFNPDSQYHMRELLFGRKLCGGKGTGGAIRSLNLRPLYTTGDHAIPWSEAEKIGDDFLPASDEEVIGALATTNAEHSEILGKLRDYKYVGKALQNVLASPSYDDEGTPYWGRNDETVPGSICDDGRLRTHMYPTLETGRWSSARPNLQNWPNNREVDYKRIFGAAYPGPLRSIIAASPGHVIVEADYSGAELAIAAFQSDDERMIRDVLDTAYDMHSHMAVLAFRLTCSPSKEGLEEAGLKHYRHLAKMVFFGLMYGRGAKAIALQAQAQGVNASVEEAQTVIDTIFRRYPKLHKFLEACFERAKSPRWIATYALTYRRVPKTTDAKLLGEYGRQFKNFPEQGGVAEAVNDAVVSALDYREKTGIPFTLVLQIHDAIYFEVPEQIADSFTAEHVPKIMESGVTIAATTLDGIPTGKKYHLRVDTKKYRYWGIPV